MPDPDSTIAQGSTAHPSAEEELLPGALLDGKYRVLEKLGSGGMGAVYAAQQLRPVQRPVALKVIKLGMDTEQVVGRFESERQALAWMDHPNIARVYDAGATQTGRPYFAMELVQGAPLTEYCERNRLSTHERLELFIPICRAVQHAHQRGLIHRDLKPSNLLVTIQDGAPVPKIIDFGIAKATKRAFTERALFTEQGQLIGTPEYMSPEQADLAAIDVDTRADIYSLGVILYQLLSGLLPLDPGALRSAPFAEMQRMIRETEPPRPSARVDQLGDARQEIAERRRTDPRSLSRRLRGDLDWITMKAMAKDRARRYASASELSEDVARHLRHEPVLASPPDAAYRVRKFVRRHRLGVGAALLLAAALLVAVAGVSVGLVRAKEAERKAREAEAKAKEDAQTALQVSGFLEGLFEVSDPGEARGKTVTAREILDRGAKRVADELKHQPPVQARLMLTMGKVYESLGLYDQAISLLEAAVETRRHALREDDLETAAALRKLGDARTQRGEYDRAATALEASLAITERLLGREHPSAADALQSLGNVSLRKGDYVRGQRLFERALAIREKALAPDHPDLAMSLYGLGAIHYRKGELARARELWERSLAIRERALGPDHPLVARSLNALAVVDTGAGQYAAARARLERVVRIQEKVLGPKHADLAGALSNLGDVLIRSDRHAEALPLLERAVEIEEAAVGPAHPELARFLERLGTATLFGAGDVARARLLFERSLAIREKVLSSTDQELTDSIVGLANCERRAGRLATAKDLFERALALNRKPDGSYHALALGALYYYAALLRDMHQPSRAAELEAIMNSLMAEAKRR